MLAASYSVKTTMMKMAQKRVESESDSVTSKKKSSASNARDLHALMLPKVEKASDDLVSNFSVLHLGFKFQYLPM
jgi:hypothetical protein